MSFGRAKRGVYPPRKIRPDSALPVFEIDEDHGPMRRLITNAAGPTIRGRERGTCGAMQYSNQGINCQAVELRMRSFLRNCLKLTLSSS